MKRPFRVIAQGGLVCLSAVPFVAVAPGVLDAHRAHRRAVAGAATPVAEATAPSLMPDPRLIFRSPFPNPTK